jgi:hypothetical protein
VIASPQLTRENLSDCCITQAYKCKKWEFYVIEIFTSNFGNVLSNVRGDLGLSTRGVIKLTELILPTSDSGTEREMLRPYP